jgi:hypothetical protein
MKRKSQPPAATSHTVRASEIGSYLYCRRAWWYQRQGRGAVLSVAQESGLDWHRRHGRRVLMASALRFAGWALILLAAAAAAVIVAENVLG